MSKSIICNLDVKLRVGGRKAPKGGANKLKVLLNDPKGNNQLLYEFLNSGGEWDDPVSGKLDLDKLNKHVKEDLRKYDVDRENIQDEFTLGTTKTGIDYLSGWVCGDWEAPVLIFLYWDGKHYRGYIPLKGNAINPINKSAFGNDEDEDIKYFKKEHGCTDEELEDVYDYIQNSVEYSFKDCLEDFESRLEIIN